MGKTAHSIFTKNLLLTEIATDVISPVDIPQAEKLQEQNRLEKEQREKEGLEKQRITQHDARRKIAYAKK